MTDVLWCVLVWKRGSADGALIFPSDAQMMKWDKNNPAPVGEVRTYIRGGSDTVQAWETLWKS